ncbi:MAG: flagellar hook-length control protein FliK [Ectothiorhodospiraceae bacterium]|nr:flagellar hook-length control protein FliK [Ectothiorhodospiraceae bacterium]
MDISPIQNSLKVDLLVKSPQSVVDAWKVGQLINATAITGREKGQATISIGGTLLQAQAPFPLSPGQSLTLEVSSLAAMAVLKVVNAANSAAGNTPAITVTLPVQANLLNQLLLQPLQVGQQLLARIPSSSIPHTSIPSISVSPQIQTILEFAGNRVSVQLSQALPGNIGQQLKLEVVTPGALAALKMLTPSGRSDSIALALRATLPQQQPLPSLLANLAWVATNVTASKSHLSAAGAAGLTTTGASVNSPLPLPLPQTVVALTRSIIEQLPTSASLRTSDGVKQAIAQSGLFLESRLAHSLTSPLQTSAIPLSAQLPVDFKGGLLGLLVSLLALIKAPPKSTATPLATQNPLATNTPYTPLPAQVQAAALATLTAQMNTHQAMAELLRSVESGLARVQLNQLVSSSPDEDGKRTWVMELPVRGDGQLDNIQICIQKETRKQAKKEAALWTVSLSIEPKGLGPIQVRISLSDGVISTHFWSENTKTTQFIQEYLPVLKKRYSEVGLFVGAINAHEGSAPVQTSAEDFLHHTLLDEKA